MVILLVESNLILTDKTMCEINQDSFLDCEKKDFQKKLRDIVEPENSAKNEAVEYLEYNAEDIYKLELKIPKYQRIYTWGYEQVKTLLDDIMAINLPKYFVGSLILHCQKIDGREELNIVDGQQRLVTIALIKYQLKDNSEGLMKFLNCDYASLDAQNNIRQNLQIIKNYLLDSEKENKVRQNINKLTFGVLKIKRSEDLDLAFTFFSNTNSKGKKLTDYDLLKPHHLRYISSDLEEQQMHLSTKWDNMISRYRSFEEEAKLNQDLRQRVPYIRVMELYLYRLRKWEQYQNSDESEDHYIKKEFEAAPIINEIPPFGERFHYGEPIQGGQHFFAYIEHFIEEYDRFNMLIDRKTTKAYFSQNADGGQENNPFRKYFTQGKSHWYGNVIEALAFCYYLKFGESYINEAIVSITRYISIIRFRLGRAYKPTILDWVRRSKIVMAIDRATSPTFFLANIERRIDNPPIDQERVEYAKSGVRKTFLENCISLTEELTKNTSVHYYVNYVNDRYGKLC
jgi:uncharacterized protein with ParB-like and HNH nuclease domain